MKRQMTYFIAFTVMIWGMALNAAPSMNTIYVQGYLRKATGSAVTDGTYPVVFSLRSGSTYFWTKTINVAVSNGFFSQSLSGASSAPYAGNINSSSIASAASGALAVNIQTIVDSQTVSFDIQASPVPLALYADRAAAVVASGVDTAAIADSAVTSIKIAASAITSSHFNSTGTLPGWDGSQLLNINASNIVGGTLSAASIPTTLPASNGAALTNLNASNISSGTLAGSLFPATLPASNGSALTNLDASNISTGTLAGARFPATLPAANGSALTNLSSANLTGALPALSGASLTGLNASNISSGTLATSLFPAFTGDATTTAGGVTTVVSAIRGVGVSATAPTTAGQILRYDGSNYVPAFSELGDIKASIAPYNGVFASAGCTSSQTLTYQVGTDTFICQGINYSAANITSGTLGAVNGSNITDLTAGNLVGALPAVSGALLTSLNASNIASGTLAGSLFPATLPAASGANLTNLSAAAVSGTLGVVNGVNITNLNAANLSGTLAAIDGSLVTGLNASNIATGTLAATIFPATLSVAGVLTMQPASGSAMTLGQSAGASALALRSGASGALTAVSGTGTMYLNSTNTTTSAIVLSASGAGGGIVLNSNATGSLTINQAVNSPINLGGGTSTGLINIGNSTGVQNLNLGAAAGAGTVIVGNTGGAAQTKIQGGTGKLILQSNSITGTAFAAMGSCQITSFTCTTGANTGKTCTGVPSTSAVVFCSPASGAGTNNPAWGVFPTAASTVTINMTAACTVASAWNCTWVVP